MRVGIPILIEERLNTDFLDILVLPRPREMTTLQMNLYAHLGRRENTSTYTQTSVGVRNEKAGDIRAFEWCPRPVVFHL